MSTDTPQGTGDARERSRPAEGTGSPLLEAEGLKKHFKVEQGFIDQIGRAHV